MRSRQSQSSLIVTHLPLQPADGCADFRDVSVHLLNAIVQVLAVFLALFKFAVKPDPHLANSP